MYPYPKCVRDVRMGIRAPLPYCDASWHVPLRVEIAVTGILLALLIAFIGARIDRLIVRSRGLRGAALLPSS
jgi:hypothetical protein